MEGLVSRSAIPPRHPRSVVVPSSKKLGVDRGGCLPWRKKKHSHVRTVSPPDCSPPSFVVNRPGVFRRRGQFNPESTLSSQPDGLRKASRSIRRSVDFLRPSSTVSNVRGARLSHRKHSWREFKR